MDFWVEANPWTGILDDNLPLALIRQTDGSFVAVKAGELRAAGDEGKSKRVAFLINKVQIRLKTCLMRTC